MSRNLAVPVGVWFLIASNWAIAGESANAELQKLADKATSPGKDVGPLRAELLRFGQRHAGSVHAVKAAAMLRDLRSPLDQFEAKNIPPLEKFDWFPKETVAVLGEHRGRQAGAVSGLAFSKNGKWLASAGSNSSVRIWDPATMRLLHSVHHASGATCVAFNKESTLLFHGGGDGEIAIADMTVDPPKTLAPCKAATTWLYALALGPAAKWLVTGGADNRLSLWDLTANPPKELAGRNEHTDAIHAIAIAPDGKTVASAGADKTIRIWSVEKENLQKVTSILADTGTVRGLAWYDDKTLVSGGDDSHLRVWTLNAGKLKLRFQLKGSEAAINGLTFSPSGKTLAVAWSDERVRTYAFSPQTGLTVKTVNEGHVMAVNTVAFPPDATYLASGSDDWSVRLWPIGPGPRLKDKTIKSGHVSHVYSLAFAPDEKGLASASYDRTARFWDLTGPTPKERSPVMKEDNALLTIALAPDGKTLVTAGLSGKIHRFDPLTARTVFTFPGHEGYVFRLAYAPAGDVIASASTDKTLRLWNPKNGKQVAAITTFENYINSVAFSPDSKYLLCCTGDFLRDDQGAIVYKDEKPVFADCAVRLFNAADRKEMYRWKGDQVLPHSLAFTPDGKYFFAGASDGNLRRWQTADPKEPEIFFKNGAAHTALACSPDGRWLAVFGPEIHLLDLASGKLARTLSINEQFGDLAFAPDSRHLAVALTTGVALLLRLDNPH